MTRGHERRDATVEIPRLRTRVIMNCSDETAPECGGGGDTTRTVCSEPFDSVESAIT